jgi:hypothetical protein
VIGVLATMILLVHTQPIGRLGAAASKSPLFSEDLQLMQVQMVAAYSAAVIVLLVLIALSVYLSRGMTPYGQRKLQEQCKV